MRGGGSSKPRGGGGTKRNQPDMGSVDGALYCICRQPSKGKMIYCESPECPTKWFHMICLKMRKAPAGDWICPNCKNLPTTLVKTSEPNKVPVLNIPSIPEKVEAKQEPELEGQIILRLPSSIAEILRNALQSTVSLQQRLQLQMSADNRTGILQFDHFRLYAKLVDLPCIVESFKTVDEKNIYKTADISQMIVCTVDPEPEKAHQAPVQDEAAQVTLDKKFLWPHGVTAPLKNVRKNRFRRSARKKASFDQASIEKEVARLLRMDQMAESVTWEVVYEQKEENCEDDQVSASGTPDLAQPAKSLEESRTNEIPSTSKLAYELFGESDCSSSDSDVEVDSVQNVKDKTEGLCLSEESEDDEPGPSAISESRTTSPEACVGSGPRIDSELLDKKRSLEAEVSALREQCRVLETRKEVQKKELETLENLALKARMEVNLRRITEELNDKQRKIANLVQELSLLESLVLSD